MCRRTHTMVQALHLPGWGPNSAPYYAFSEFPPPLPDHVASIFAKPAAETERPATSRSATTRRRPRPTPSRPPRASAPKLRGRSLLLLSPPPPRRRAASKRVDGKVGMAKRCRGEQTQGGDTATKKCAGRASGRGVSSGCHPHDEGMLAYMRLAGPAELPGGLFRITE